MKLYAYSIRDTKADTNGIPFFLKNDASAKRAFYNLVNDPQSNVHRNPEDYHLLLVGFWDDETFELETIYDRKVIAYATELKDNVVTPFPNDYIKAGGLPK